MEEEQVSYEVLQDLLRTERRSNKLTPLPPRFWSEVREFLGLVTQRFRKEQERDPWGRRVMALSDEVKNARQAARSLWALRERKLAMLALAHTHERQRPTGVTPDEAELYARLLEVLDQAREQVLEDAGRVEGAPPAAQPERAAPRPAPLGAAGAAPAKVPAAATERPDAAGAPPPPGPAPGQGGAESSGPDPPAAEGSERSGAAGHAPAPATVPPDVQTDDGVVAIRALGDIPPFVGPDMQTYILKEGDVATVPEPIARLLERRRKAVVVKDK